MEFNNQTLLPGMTEVAGFNFSELEDKRSRAIGIPRGLKMSRNAPREIAVLDRNALREIAVNGNNALREIVGRGIPPSGSEGYHLVDPLRSSRFRQIVLWV